MMPRFPDCFPAANTEGLVYPAEYENFEWTTSFFSGMLWLLYEHTGDPVYRPILQKHLESFYERVEAPGSLDTHDLGFLYSLSCYPAVLLQKDPRAEACFLKAAQALRSRYFPQAGIIQAWGVYGFALSYRHTGDRSFLDTSCKLLDYYLERLPEDGVCYWDLHFTQGSEPRDSSAAAIVCCGILELLKHLPLTYPRRMAYEAALNRTILALAKGYTTWNLPQADGLLLHGVYSKPDNRGVDECTIWGDYYYI